MNRRLNRTARATAMLATVVTTTAAHAVDYYWQGGAGAFNSPNYTSVDATPTVTPNVSPGIATTDYVFIGGGTDATPSAVTSGVTFTTGHIRIGTLSTAAQPTAQAGSGSVTNTAGTLKASAGSAAGSTAVGEVSLIVGYNSPGSLTISGGTVSASFFGKIGYADTPGATGTGTVTLSAGTLAITNRGLQIGEGLPGVVTMTGGTLSISNGTTGQLAIGTTSTGTFTQSAGTTTTGNNFFVGRNTSTSSSATVSGGSLSVGGSMTVADGANADTSLVLSGNANVSTATTTNTTTGVITSGALSIGGANAQRTSVVMKDSAVVAPGNISVGNAAGATDTSLLVTDNAKLTSTGSLTIAAAATTNSSATINGNAIVGTVGNFTLGGSADPNAVLNVGGNATINVGVQSGNPTIAPSITAHLFIGRSTATSTLNMTGGTINAPNLALFGTASAGALVTVNHSAGTINSGTSATSTNRGFKIGDTNGTVNYNLSNTGVINSANGPLVVGRQGAVATLNQTGGTLTAAGGLHIGYAENTTASFQTGTGTYVLSGGSGAVSVPAGVTTPALTVGNQGTGTLRIVGSAGTLNVTGDALVDAIPGRPGTLAYQLKPADPSLSTINVTGAASFTAGAVLNLDFNAVTPTKGVYNLLSAASVVDNGLVWSAPAGWGYKIFTAGAGQILRAYAGDLNADGHLNADDYALMDRGNAKHLTTGADGDLNADGTINSADYLLIDSAYAQLNGPFSPSFLAERESEFGPGYVAALTAAVPEPTSLLVCGLAIPALLTRRRRQF